MSNQGKDWSVVASKMNKKKDKENEVAASMKQQYADYLHTNKGGIDDLSDAYENEFVPETPAESSNVPTANAPAVQEITSKEGLNVEALPAYSAWLKRATMFDQDPRFKKEDISLVKYDNINPEAEFLLLDEPDITPIPRGWGTCLLGRFTGRFPGKQAIYGLMQRWPCKARVTFHRKGWLCFQFRSNEDMEATRQKGPFPVFGTPLVLQPMPLNFDPDMEPEIMVPVWLRLVDLPLHLWNLTAVSKIASCIGTPLTTDFSTLRRETMDGPRIQVIVNTAKRPRESIPIRLPTGENVDQKIEYEFMPKYCTQCKFYGHFADECRGRTEEYRNGERQRSVGRERSKSATRAPYTQPYRPPNQPWRKDQNMNANKRPEHQPNPRRRSTSRPRNEWKPTGKVYPIAATYMRPRDGILDANNEPAVIENIPTSPNKFAPLGMEPGPSTFPAPLTINDILAAVVPPLLQGLQGNVALAKGAPVVNTEKRHRSKSRDPRVKAWEEAQKEGVQEEVGQKGNEREVVDVTNENSVGKEIQTKASKTNLESHSHCIISNDGDAIDVSDEARNPKHDDAREEERDAQDAEAIGRQSRSEKKKGESSNRKKTKSKSRSHSRPKRDATPGDWEDGLEGDPGIAQ